MSDEYTCDDCKHAREATDDEIEFGTHFCKLDKKFVERVINCSVWEEKKTIWVLFSIENEYNQPEHNLEAWWYEKPTFNVIAKLWNIEVDLRKGNALIGRLLRGMEVRSNCYDYRLREISEGIVKEV